MPQLAIFVTLKSKPGQRGAVMALWQDRVRDRAALNPLETSYVYAFDIRDDTVITIAEVFESMDAFHQTTHADWFKDYMKELTQHLDAKPVFNLAIPQWTKPVELAPRAGTPVAAPSMMAKLANLLPSAGPIKKVQDYLKLPMAISVALKTKPGQRDAVKQLWDDQVRQRAQGNPVESNYVYAFDMKDDSVIRISEVFETTDAFHQMAHAKWFKSYMKAVTLLLDGKPEYQMTTPQWIK
jgi:quinol monooxygenase YgiN